MSYRKNSLGPCMQNVNWRDEYLRYCSSLRIASYTAEDVRVGSMVLCEDMHYNRFEGHWNGAKKVGIMCVNLSPANDSSYAHFLKITW